MAKFDEAESWNAKNARTYEMLVRNVAKLDALISKDKERLDKSIRKLLRSPEELGKDGPILAQLVKDGWKISRLCSEITGKPYCADEYEDYYNELTSDPTFPTP